MFLSGVCRMKAEWRYMCGYCCFGVLESQDSDFTCVYELALGIYFSKGVGGGEPLKWN